MSRIPGLWQELATLTANLPQRIGLEKYVLITGDLPDFPGSPFKPTAASTSETTDAVYYHALIAVKDFTDLPEPLKPLELSREINHSRMVKFQHLGPPTTIGTTATQALFAWLPQSRETIAHNLEWMILPANYDRNCERTDPHGEFEYCLFIK